MRHDLDHLPATKQRELERVTQLVFEEFEDALSLANTDWKKKGRILKVILYGSYARGTWVDEPHTAKGYQSDYDLLIIVNDQRLTDRVRYWSNLDDRLMRDYGIAGTIRTPVNFIVHSLKEVNDGLSEGRYFYMDIARDGIALYEADDNDELARPKPKTPHAALEMAREYYEEWFPAATGMLATARFSQSEGRLKDAAFLLHQATERYLDCVLLSVTFHAPHIHNLAFLRTQAERLDPRLQNVWPEDNRKQRGMFEKLKEAYVKARYAKHYRISDEELDWLGGRIEELALVVEAVCLERIGQLEATAREAG
jgi:uncharacterized protein